MNKKNNVTSNMVREGGNMKKRIRNLLTLVMALTLVLGDAAVFAAEPATAVGVVQTAEATGDAGSGNGAMDDPDSYAGGGNQDSGGSGDGGTGDYQPDNPAYTDNSAENGHNNGQNDPNSGGNNQGSETVKDDDGDNTPSSPTNVSDNTVSDDSNSDNSVSDNTVSENTISENTVSENTVSENTVSENTISDNTVSENTISDTVSDNTASGNSVVSHNTVHSCGYHWETTTSKGVQFKMWTPYWLMTMLKGSGWKIGKKKTTAVLMVPMTNGKSFKIKKKLKTDDSRWSISTNAIAPEWLQTVCKNKMAWTAFDKVDADGDHYIEVYYAFAKSKSKFRKKKWTVAYKVTFYNYKHKKNAFRQIDGADFTMPEGGLSTIDYLNGDIVAINDNGDTGVGF